MELEKVWPTLEFLASTDASEIVSSELWDIGTVGIETVVENTDIVRLRAYFENGISLSELENIFKASLDKINIPISSLLSFSIYNTPDTDWLEKWKSTYSYFSIGTKWIIVPSWKTEEALANPISAGRIWIKIDPGMAFGTGTHETTRLCLELIENLSGNITKALDVGTGTGILSIAIARLFENVAVDACDIDSEALKVAKENIEINQTDQIIIKLGSVEDYPQGYFDITVANLTADVIISLAQPLLNSISKETGKLILSGILDFQIQDVINAIEDKGGQCLEVKEAGEWRALLCQQNI